MSDFDSLAPLFDAFPPTSTDDWEAKIREDLGGKDYDKVLVWDSLEGVTVQPYYRADDLGNFSHVDPEADTPPLAASTTAPANAWRTRQDVAAPSLSDAADRAVAALDRGASDLGVRVRIDDGTLHGVPVQRIDDLVTLLERIPLADTPTHWSGGPAAVALYGMWRAVAQRRDVAHSDLQGSIQYDPVAALATGRLSAPETAFALATDLVRAHRETPQVRTLTVSAAPYHDAGASLVQEVAYTLGALSELLAQGTDHGASVAALTSALQFAVPVSTSYFLEIAKLRALRLLVPQVVAPYADAAGEDVALASTDLFVQSTPSRRTQTLYDPYVNMLRGTTAGMAAVVGGCDVLSIAPYDALFRAPSDFSQRIARNTSLILDEEAHLGQVADPAAGAYYIEALTDQVAEKAWEQFQSLEAEGGLLAALRSGRAQSSIADVREKRMQRTKDRRRVLVGTNHYPDTEETKREDVDVAPDGVALERSGTAELPEPTVEAIRTALANGATLGDVVDALRNGTPDFETLPSARAAAPFEALRLQTERSMDDDSERPVVTLLPMGHPAMRSARATFSRNFFGVGGFAVRENLRFDTPADAARAVVEDEAAIAVLCSSDREYPDLAPQVQDALDEAGSDALLVVAGNPARLDGDVPADGFIHMGSPLHDILRDFQERLDLR
jgi:methylmalonyl-CoA mutase